MAKYGEVSTSVVAFSLAGQTTPGQLFVEDNYFPSGAMPRNQDKGQGV